MYYGKNVPDGPWDYIVIGSGMGGMTCAGLLARLGKRVLVLEQHFVPGGLTHTFRRKDWVWDVGVHSVGQVTEHAVVGRLLTLLTDDELRWAPLGPVYDEFCYPDGVRIDFPSEPGAWRAALCDAFPGEQAAIDAYVDETCRAAKAMQGYSLGRLVPPRVAAMLPPLVGREGERYCRMRTGDVLDRITSNARLKTALTAQWGYYGSPPSRSSFAMHALVAYSFRHGGYYPRGGSARIAETMLTPVVRAGGAVRIRAEVERILVRRGRAIGVALGGGEEIVARQGVVSAIGAQNTIQRLLPPAELGKPWCRSITRLPPSPGCVALYIGFEGDPRQAGATGASRFFCETWDLEQESWDFRRPDTVPPSLYMGFCSLRDPEHDPGPKQHHTGIAITFLPWEPFARWESSQWMKRGADYDALKQELGERLLRHLLDRMPALAPMVAYTEVSTPVSTTHFIRSPQGSIYGTEPTPERFTNPWLRPRTPLRRLFLAGCDAGMPGVVGALVGGALAAIAAEPVGAVRVLKQVYARGGGNKS